MYRIGDKVEVINEEQYHNWRMGTTAIVLERGGPVLELKSEDSPNGFVRQGLYPRDVKFVSRTDYRPDDYAIVVGRSYSHSIPIGTKVKVISMRGSGTDCVVNVVHEEEHHYQGVHPESLMPIEFSNVYTEGLSASPTTFATLAAESFTANFIQLAEQLHGMGTNYDSNRFIPVDTHFTTSAHVEPVRYAIAVPNNTVTVHSITDRPKCDDENLFTEFTSWMHPFIGGARSAEEGLIIDACTVITFLGKSDQDDLFSIRYEDTGNIVIAKGKLNNGYAKYRV